MSFKNHPACQEFKIFANRQDLNLKIGDVLSILLFLFLMIYDGKICMFEVLYAKGSIKIIYRLFETLL